MVENAVVKHEPSSTEIQTRSDELAKYWGKNNLTPQLRYQISKVSVELGLDPFLRHLEVLGGNLYVTVAGLQHNAAKSGLLDGIKTRPIIGQERTDILEAFGMPKDTICFHALVYRKDAAQPFDGWGFASKADVSGQMQRPKDMAAMAENRAQARALRKAFAIGLTADIEIGNDRPSREDDEDENAIAVDLNSLDSIKRIADDNTVETQSDARANDAEKENDTRVVDIEHESSTETKETGTWQPHECLNEAAALRAGLTKTRLEEFVNTPYSEWGPFECGVIQNAVGLVKVGEDIRTVFARKEGE